MIRDVEERFGLFRDLIESVSPIYITEFNAYFEIIYSNNPNAELFSMLFSMEINDSFPHGEELQSVAENITKPVIFTNSVGMTWLSDVYMEGGELRRIYLLGPVFLDDISLRKIETRLGLIQLSSPVRNQFLGFLHELPVITLDRYYDFGIMLHKAVRNEVIDRSDFRYPDMYDDSNMSGETLRDYHGAYRAERRMCQMIEDGNLQYQRAQDELVSISGNLVRNVTGDHLRQEKNVAVVLCTVYARAAMRGGVEPETVYVMSDLYIQRIEEAGDFTKVKKLMEEMAEGFVRMVYRHKMQSGSSPQIRKACDYIGTHLDEDLNIQDIAGRFGYSGYYFSNKFKKEMGVSFREYIRNRKIEKGKELLRNTNMDVGEISISLGYESVSYFGEIFKKAVGVSPGEYRSKESNK